MILCCDDKKLLFVVQILFNLVISIEVRYVSERKSIRDSQPTIFFQDGYEGSRKQLEHTDRDIDCCFSTSM
ncbi:hypothetical protein R6Q59_010484 [Mikania micrantha]